MTPPTILFQPSNGVGLGHISRLAAIALAIRAMDSTVLTPFVVEGESHGLLESLNLPHVSLPILRQVYAAAGTWRGWPISERRDLFVEISNVILQRLQPDLAVFDCFPNHCFMLAACRLSIPLVLCVRKIHDWALYMKDMDQLLPRLRLIIVAHEPGGMELPESFRSKAVFAGSITRPVEDGPNDPSANHEKLVIITGGAGGYPGTVNYFNLALAGLAAARKKMPELKGLLVTGPLFKEWEKLELWTGVKVVLFDPHLVARVRSASAVISQGGYNTINELQYLGVPAICIPARRDQDDQRSRVTESATAYDHITVFQGETPGELASQLLASIARGPARVRSNAPSGAHTAARILYDLVSKIRCAQ